ncbi:unnamed protein product [Aureobasidium uvarum]|uniref:Uncharacterized protein n=1 Tax=Aureobasidium uvarum TaxID=2773716 RepID=A0A9N8PQ73_9PEZI|nr:unnamed protein product [Aureobasidium uvarum]
MADIKKLPKGETDTLLDKAVDLFNDKLYTECEAVTRTVLKRKLSIWKEIFADTVHPTVDLTLARGQKQRYKAEGLYYNTRFLWPLKKDAVVDRKLKNLRETLDELREDQRNCRPSDVDEYEDNEFMVEMYQKYSRVIEAEGDWNKRLRERAQRILAEEEAEMKEMEARAQTMLYEDAFEAAGRMFGHDTLQSDGSQIQPDDEDDDSEV